RGPVFPSRASGGARHTCRDRRQRGAWPHLFREGDRKVTLEARKLVAGYGDKAVLDKVSFTLEDGEILAFFGHNGAGKSTTLKAVIGLIPVREGEILLDGRHIEKLPTAAR